MKLCRNNSLRDAIPYVFYGRANHTLGAYVTPIIGNVKLISRGTRHKADGYRPTLTNGVQSTDFSRAFRLRERTQLKLVLYTSNACEIRQLPEGFGWH